MKQLVNILASLTIAGAAATCVAFFDAPTWAWIATGLIIYQIVLHAPANAGSAS